MARRWLKIGGGIASTVTTILALFALLVTNFGFEITGTDDICAGTLENPCISFINVTNPTADDVDIYNPNMIKLKFSPEIPEFYLFRKDGRCKGGKSCSAPNGVSLSGWNYIDFTNNTKPVKDKAYVYRFSKKTTKQFLLWGLKNNPKEIIKWSFFVGDTELDPVWLPFKFTFTTVQVLNKNINHTKRWNETKDYYFTNYTCYYHEANDTFTPCEQYNYTEYSEYSELIIDLEYQELKINGKLVNSTELGLWCWDDGKNKVWCNSYANGIAKFKKKEIIPGTTYCSFDYDAKDFSCNNYLRDGLESTIKSRFSK